MANAIYPLFKQDLLQAGSGVNLASATIKAALISTVSGTNVTSPYAYNAADEFWSSVAATLPADGGQVLADGVIAVKTLASTSVSTTAVFSAADVVFSNVPAFDAAGTGDGECQAVIIYHDDGSAASTSRLIAYLDNTDGVITGLPVRPNGTNINLNWNVSGIFQL